MPAAETLDDVMLKKTVESLLFITDHALSLEALAKVTGVKDAARLAEVIGQIKREMDEKESPVQVLEVAEGYQMATRANYAPFVRKLFAERMTMRLSTAALETLAIVAYKQPLTRAEVEEIRGVEVIAALETLLEKRLLKVVGRKETVGRPLMYGTTMDFLRHFGLKSLEDMPPIDQFIVEQTPAAPADNAIPNVVEDGAPAGASGEAVASTTEEAWRDAGPLSAAAEEAPAASAEVQPRNIWGEDASDASDEQASGKSEDPQA